MPVPERVTALRVVATPAALDRLPAGTTTLRIAADEALLLGVDSIEVDDPSAIIECDDGFSQITLDPVRAEAWLTAVADWPPPRRDGEVAQGLAAGVPVKVLAESDRVTVLVATPLAHELAARL